MKKLKVPYLETLDVLDLSSVGFFDGKGPARVDRCD